MIRERLNRPDNISLERGILRIYENQTNDEQRTESTNHNNGVGFTGADARFLTSLAKWIIKGRRDYRRREGQSLSEKQAARARRMMQKYAGQLARIAEQNIRRMENEIGAY
jgi:hypothetical protein